jgi:hypothetical protein
MGLVAIQDHRTARNAPLRMKWMYRMLPFDGGRHRWASQRLSHWCGPSVRWSMRCRWPSSPAAPECGVEGVEQIAVECSRLHQPISGRMCFSARLR